MTLKDEQLIIECRRLALQILFLCKHGVKSLRDKMIGSLTLLQHAATGVASLFEALDHLHESSNGCSSQSIIQAQYSCRMSEG